jgi:hypothetical protein
MDEEKRQIGYQETRKALVYQVLHHPGPKLIPKFLIS